LSLQNQLAETEDKIAFARTFYNDRVSMLNQLVRTFPWLLLTGLASVGVRVFYEAPEGQDQAPVVRF
jgi:LemA protein